MDGPLAPDELAAAIADGRVLDWSSLVDAATTPQDRARLARFELLARIAGVHATPDAERSTDAADHVDDLCAGDSWGTLLIVGRLGAGTSGTVYRAHDPALARDVALKILRLPVAAGGAALDAVREGRLLARVRHPHVVTVYGADERDGRVGVWMELVEGRTLEDELDSRGPLSPDEVRDIGRVLCRALKAVHDAGLVHRDVKTQNVMVDGRDGRLVLMDFSAGRERVDPDTPEATWPASLAGSPLYLAPELLDGAPASVQSDIYSLGVLLFRLLTGAYPVEGQTVAEVAEAHRRRPVVRTHAARPATPAAIAGAIDRALSPDLLTRHANAAALDRDLASDDDRGQAFRWTWRRAAAAALILIAGSGYGVWRARGSTEALVFAPRDYVLVADFENRTGDPTSTTCSNRRSPAS